MVTGPSSTSMFLSAMGVELATFAFHPNPQQIELPCPFINSILIKKFNLKNKTFTLG